MAGPDWTAFATAFLGDTAKYINERKDKAEEYEDKLREEAERSASIMKKQVQFMDLTESITKQLKAKGVPELVIRSAAASGPTGLTDLQRNWQAAESKYGAEVIRANPELYAVASITPEQARMTGEGALNTREFIEQNFGFTKPTTGSYDAGKVTVWDRMLGRNAKERVRAKLDQEMAAMGYSIYDINEAAKAAEYRSLVPGAYVEYKTPKVFTVDEMTDEAKTIRDQVLSLQVSDQYKNIEDQLETARKALQSARNVGNASQVAEYQAQVDALTAQRNQMLTSYLRPQVMQKAEYYGESYLKVMGDTIDNLIGIPGFSSSLSATPTEESTDMDAPMGDTSQVEPTAQAPVIKDWADKAKKTAPSTKFGEVAIVEKDGEDVVVLAKPRMIGGTMVPAGTQLPKEIADEVMADIEANTTASVPMPDATPAEIGTAAAEGQRIPITREQYKAMTRDERKEAGLPVSALGGYLEGPFMADTAPTSMAIKEGAGSEKFYAVEIPGVIGAKKVKGKDLALIPDAYLQKETGAVVIREMDKDEDLKTWGPGRLKSAFGKGIASAPAAKEEEKQPATWADRERKPAAKKRDKVEGTIPYGDIKPGQGYGVEAFGPGNIFTNGKQTDTLPVDEATDALLRKSALDMVNFARDKGLTKDSRPEELLDAITKWAKENNVSLPAGKSALIYAVKYGLGLRK